MLQIIKTISRATPKDAQALEDFLALVNGEDYRDLARNYIRCMFSNDFRRPIFLIAKEGEAIIGAAAYSEELFTVNTWGISWVSVHPDRRNIGLGQALVQACLQEITNRVLTPVNVMLSTYPGQTKLYEKLGFKKGGNDCEGGCFMILHLDKNK